MIINFEEKYIKDIISLWNEMCIDSIFRPWDEEYFKHKFLDNALFDKDGFFLYIEDDSLIGMGMASVTDAKWGYINFVVVKKEYQRKGYGKKILNELEGYIKGKGKDIVRLYFASPFNFEWLIPGFGNHYHPGAPAVDINSTYYLFLANNGYNIDGMLDGYHMDITNYEYPEKILRIEEENIKDGYTVEVYDSSKHHGFKELFEHLDNPGWHNAVKSNLAKEKPDPMLVVQKDGVILGWTGPMNTDATGRGYLAGVGVDPLCQGRGLGKLLFSKLCYYSKLNQATYMTLFTGTENNARRIYKYTGFEIMRTFAIMRKELK